MKNLLSNALIRQNIKKAADFIGFIHWIYAAKDNNRKEVYYERTGRNGKSSLYGT